MLCFLAVRFVSAPSTLSADAAANTPPAISSKHKLYSSTSNAITVNCLPLLFLAFLPLLQTLFGDEDDDYVVAVLVLLLSTTSSSPTSFSACSCCWCGGVLLNAQNPCLCYTRIFSSSVCSIRS